MAATLSFTTHKRRAISLRTAGERASWTQCNSFFGRFTSTGSGAIGGGTARASAATKTNM